VQGRIPCDSSEREHLLNTVIETRGDGDPGRGSLTLERGLRALAVLAEHPDGLTVSELAASLSTHRAGVYRLLKPLAAHRLVGRDGGGRYHLGVGLIELANHVRPRLLELALPRLQSLADELKATAGLTVRDGEHEAVVATVVEPRSTDVHLAYRAGLRHPIDRVASGLAILSANPPRDGERSEVTIARDRGWAVSAGELLPGTIGVGAPIGRPADAAVSAVWIEPRDNAEAAARVMRCAREIAEALG